MSTPSHAFEPRDHNHSIFQGLEHFYKFENPLECRSLLGYHPNLVNKLREALGHIEAAFEGATELRVQVKTEWEGPLLWVFVYGSWSAEAAAQKQKQLNDAWGLAAWSETDGMFNVDVRLR